MPCLLVLCILEDKQINRIRDRDYNLWSLLLSGTSPIHQILKMVLWDLYQSTLLMSGTGPIETF